MCKQKTSQKPIYGVEDSHVKTSQSQGKEDDCKQIEVDSFGYGTNSLKKENLNGSLLKTSSDYFQVITEKIFNFSCPPLPKAVFLCLDLACGQTQDLFGEMDWRSLGESLILNTSDSPNDAIECLSLSILEKEVPQKYFFSKVAAKGILSRSVAEGITLPQILLKALQNTAELSQHSPLSSLPSQLADLTPQAQALAGNQSLRVRSLIPIECERLQGFPDNWTLL